MKLWGGGGGGGEGRGISLGRKINCITGGNGLVVVTRPCPQTLHRSHDNLQNPYRIASIFYM